MIKCGALDELKAKRSQMMAVLDRALDLGAKSQQEQSSGQISFFNLDVDSSFNKDKESLPNIDEWQDRQRLTFEKEILGFYISGHPLTSFQTEIAEFTDYTTKTLKRAIDGEEVRLVALITDVKLTNTKKTNERMAILRAQDLEGDLEAVVFPSSYTALAGLIKEGEVVFIRGKVSTRDDEPKIIVNDIRLVHEIYSAIRSLKIDLSTSNEEKFASLKKKLSYFPGKIPVYLKFNTKDQKSVQIVVGKDLYVTPNENLMAEIKQLVGEENFSVAFS